MYNLVEQQVEKKDIKNMKDTKELTIQNNSFNPSKNNCPNIFMTKLKQRINKFF
jgi:hypothetical protein